MDRFSRKFNIFFFFNILLFSSSCTLHRLDVQTQYFTHENLASYHADTPDPRLDHPTIGQRLLIQWTLSSEEIVDQELVLYLKVRFRNHQEREIKVCIQKRKGYYLYVVKDQDYFETKGILTYFAEIRNQSSIIASWKHPLWTDLITFDFKEDQKNGSQET